RGAVGIGFGAGALVYVLKGAAQGSAGPVLPSPDWVNDPRTLLLIAGVFVLALATMLHLPAPGWLLLVTAAGLILAGALAARPAPAAGPGGTTAASSGDARLGTGPAAAGPARPTPAGPTPAGPTPAGPTPAGPTPAGPTPAGPTPAGPTPAGPTPAGPTPAGPTPAGPTGQIVIRRRGADRIRRGHPWLYRRDIVNPKDAEPGSIVSVRDERDTILGKAFFSSQSQISLRFLSRGDATIDEAFFQERFALADRLRERLGVDPLLSRRIYSEGDLLPGWVIDRYGDRLVVQSLIQAADRLQPLVTNIVMDRYRPRSILFRNDSRVRELEGLELKQEVAGDPIPDLLVINEDGKEIAGSLTAGQKTGTYLDQRDNHRAARRYARGRALDAFSYTGGFAVQIADRCERVESVDISAEAVELARSNAERNGLKNVECIEANAFDFLRERHKEGRQYDTIILDPPAFAKNKDSLEAA